MNAEKTWTLYLSHHILPRPLSKLAAALGLPPAEWDKHSFSFFCFVHTTTCNKSTAAYPIPWLPANFDRVLRAMKDDEEHTDVTRPDLMNGTPEEKRQGLLLLLFQYFAYQRFHLVQSPLPRNVKVGLLEMLATHITRGEPEVHRRLLGKIEEAERSQQELPSTHTWTKKSLYIKNLLHG